MWEAYTDCLHDAKQSEELWSLLSLCAVLCLTAVCRVVDGQWMWYVDNRANISYEFYRQSDSYV